MLTGSIGRRWKKLRSLSWGEVHTRSAQAIQRRTDLWQAQLGIPYAEAGSSGSSGKFFFETRDLPEILRCLRDKLPVTVQDILSRADRICEHRFDLLGYRNLDYGREIDWHKDAVSGKVAPRLPWFKVPFLDYATVGDVKVTWELNRNQHLVILAKAFHLSGDQRYLKELVSQWRDWQHANPYPYGVNWSSSLEVAFRSLAWLWIRALLRDTPIVPGDFWADLDRELNLSARHLERYLSTYFSPNTHLIGEGVALFFIGTLVSSRRAKAWQARGWHIVLEQAGRQVQADGFHFEQSPYYHVYTIDFFMHSYLLARANGIEIPPSFERALLSMLDALALLAKDGTIPRFGDDDGGRLFDGQRNTTDCLTDPFVTGAALFHRADFKALHPELIEEAVWLLGCAGVKEFAGLRSAASPPEPMGMLPAAGLYLLTDAAAQQRLVLDAGQQGTHGGGHSHADALSVQLSLDGHEVLTDPGTFVYVSGGNDRQHYRSTCAHNTVSIDHQDQMASFGPFPWASEATVRAEQVVRGRNFSYLRASHDGYRRFPDPITHRRTIFHLDGGFWLIHDDLYGSSVHELELNWRLAPGLKPEMGDNGVQVQCGEKILRMDFVEDSDWKHRFATGVYSPCYGRQEPCEVLHCSAKLQLPYSVATAFHVVSKGSIPSELKRLGGQARGAYAYRGGCGNFALLNRANSGDLTSGAVSADADFLCYGRGADDRTYLILCNARTARVNGQLLFESEKPVAYFEAISSPLGVEQWSASAVSVDAEALEEVMTKALSAAEVLGTRG